MFFLEHVVSKEGIKMDPQKVEAVRNGFRPTTVMEIHNFIGLASYYSRFVNGLAAIAFKLTIMTQKNVPFQWSEECEKSFQKLKTLLTTTPILALSVEGKDFVVYCDASRSRLNIVLM